MSLKSQALKRWIACVVVVACLATGALLARHLTLILPVQADSDRIFELRIYHAVPGKLPVMEERFRDKTSKILARHHLNVTGYWVTEDPADNAFVFLLAHASREEAKKNWEAFRSDPEFQEVAKSEQSEKTLEKADILWLRPTDFSPTIH